jgi:ABC-type Co2+ transport system permease subunit
VIAYLAWSVDYIMEAYLIMGPWVLITSMFYLLSKRAHKFRRQGTFRLFATCVIMAVVIPLSTTLVGMALRRFVPGEGGQLVFIILAPVLLCYVFAIAVTLIQKYLGADAETALALSWPIVVITYAVPMVVFFLLSLFHIPWLTGQSAMPS